MARREQPPTEALEAFEEVLDELAISAAIGRTVWFGMPAARVEGKMFLALWGGALLARIGAEEVDARVLAGDGVRFDPSGKGKAMKDWLESNGEHAEWLELAICAVAFSTPT